MRKSEMLLRFVLFVTALAGLIVFLIIYAPLAN